VISPENSKNINFKFASGAGSLTQRINVKIDQPNYFSRRNIIPAMQESPSKNPYLKKQKFMGLIHNFPVSNKSAKRESRDTTVQATDEKSSNE